MRFRLSKICILLIAFVLVIYINLCMFSAIDTKGEKKGNFHTAAADVQDYGFDFKFMKNYFEDAFFYRFNRARGRTKRFKSIQLNMTDISYNVTAPPPPKVCKLLELLPLELQSFHSRENVGETIHVKTCDIKKFGRINNGQLHLKLKNVQKVWLFYIRGQGKKLIFSPRHTLFSRSNKKVDDNLRSMLLGKECWNGCLSKNGPCQNFCGKDAFCCRKGFAGCPNNIIEVRSLSSFHSCTFSSVKFSLKNAVIKHKLKEYFFKLEMLIDNKFYEEFHVCMDFSVQQPVHHHQNVTPSRHKRSLNFATQPQISSNSPNLTAIESMSTKAKSSTLHTTTASPQSQSKPPNILMIVIDHLSYKDFVNRLKHFRHLATTRRNTYIFKGFYHISENITTQVNAMLTGKMQPKDDAYSRIFQSLHKSDYKTLFSENDHGSSSIQQNCRKNSVTFYLQPWWQALKKTINIIKNSGCLLQYGFEHLTQFFHSTKIPGKKFAFYRTSLSLHDQADRIIDKKFVDLHDTFSFSGVLNSTVLMFLGTHSPNTEFKLNDKVSFLSLSIPPYFYSDSKLMDNLKNNIKILTSTFDVHATLKHLINWPVNNEPSGTPHHGKSLFSNISELNRNCQDAGIENQVCPCST